MADEPTPEERREPDHARPERGPEEPPGTEFANAVLAIGRRVQPSREPTEFADRLNPLEGSVLDHLIRDPLDPSDSVTTLPIEVRTVLWAASQLKAIETSPDAIRQLRDNLRASRKSLKRWRSVRAPKDVPIPKSAEDLVELMAPNDEDTDFRLVDQRLSVLEQVARMFENAIKDAGYRWNWDTGKIETLPGAKGGRPRQLLRDLVRALLRHYQIDENTIETRERIAAELAQFFSASLLDTSKGSTLSNAVDHSLAAE